MSSPPPFTPPAPARRGSNTALIVVLILVILIPCVGLIVFGFLGFNFAQKTVFPMVGCMMTYESAGKAMEAYVKEKGAYPKAATWQDDIAPFYKKHLEAKKEDYGPFPPSKPDDAWSCAFGDPSTGMAYNDDVAGKKKADVKDPSITVVLFEVEKIARNQHEKYKPREATTSPKFFGEHRGWIRIMGDGELTGIKNNKQIKVD